jgi:hypothetical protein
MSVDVATTGQVTRTAYRALVHIAAVGVVVAEQVADGAVGKTEQLLLPSGRSWMPTRRYLQALRQALRGSVFEASSGFRADAAATAAESVADRAEARPSRISARSITVAATPSMTRTSSA